MKEKVLLVVVGPTAVGKTELCINLANQFNTAIISADSRQFYKEMSIGTAKPTKEELSLAAHYFISTHSIADNYSVGKYEEEALTLLEKLFQEKKILILTGGSGLFVKAVTEGLDTLPEGVAEIRNSLNKVFEKQGLEPLLKELKTADPEFYEIVDIHNHRRVIRALEVIRATGRPFSDLRSGRKKERPFKVIKVGLNRDRGELYERINKRVDNMIEAGLVEEVKSLYKFKNKQAMQTVGYNEILNYLDNQYSLQEAIELIKRNTRRYAKRQLTWFRKDEEIRWFHPDEEMHELELFIYHEL